MKNKPKFPMKEGKESKREEKREAKMSPAAYKRMEIKEGIHGYKRGGKVGKRGC